MPPEWCFSQLGRISKKPLTLTHLNIVRERKLRIYGHGRMNEMQQLSKHTTRPERQKKIKTFETEKQKRHWASAWNVHFSVQKEEKEEGGSPAQLSLFFLSMESTASSKSFPPLLLSPFSLFWKALLYFQWTTIWGYWTTGYSDTKCVRKHKYSLCWSFLHFIDRPYDPIGLLKHSYWPVKCAARTHWDVCVRQRSLSLLCSRVQRRSSVSISPYDACCNIPDDLHGNIQRHCMNLSFMFYYLAWTMWESTRPAGRIWRLTSLWCELWTDWVITERCEVHSLPLYGGRGFITTRVVHLSAVKPSQSPRTLWRHGAISFFRPFVPSNFIMQLNAFMQLPSLPWGPAPTWRRSPAECQHLPANLHLCTSPNNWRKGIPWAGRTRQPDVRTAAGMVVCYKQPD